MTGKIQFLKKERSVASFILCSQGCWSNHVNLSVIQNGSWHILVYPKWFMFSNAIEPIMVSICTQKKSVSQYPPYSFKINNHMIIREWWGDTLSTKLHHRLVYTAGKNKMIWLPPSVRKTHLCTPVQHTVVVLPWPSPLTLMHLFVLPL